MTVAISRIKNLANQKSGILDKSGRFSSMYIIFDRRLFFVSHLKYIKKKDLNSINILKFIGNTEWEADSNTDFSDILKKRSYFVLSPWCIQPLKTAGSDACENYVLLQ